jgi:hypothetical protein
VQIAELQREGKLVPSEITVELLRKAIGAGRDERSRSPMPDAACQHQRRIPTPRAF